MFQIQEINGKLFKIVEKKVDNYNVVRKAIPLSEAEFELMRKALEKKQKNDMDLLLKHKGKLPKARKADVGEPELDQTEEGEELESDVTPRKEKPKKAFVPKQKPEPQEEEEEEADE